MKKEYTIYVNNQPIYVTEKVYRAYWQSVEHERYQEKENRKKPSLDHTMPGSSLSFIEVQHLMGTNPTQEAVDAVFLRERLDQLLVCLNDQERELIDMIYFQQMTEVEVANKWNVQHSAINKRKHRILKKLRTVWEETEASC